MTMSSRSFTDTSAAIAPADTVQPEAVAGLSFSTPAIALMLALIFIPITLVIFLAITDWRLGQAHFNFVGIENFRSLFADSEFTSALVNTFVYAAIVVPVTVALGLLIAISIESGTGLRTFYRAIHFLPVIATLAAMALAWEAMLNPTIGLFTQVLQALGMPTANWLRDPDTALVTLAVIGIWHQLGLAMILFLAGLKTIPRELYDAAEVDGAFRAWDRFWTVTFPMLGPTTMFVTIVVATRAFQVFDTVRMLTLGGPGEASEVLLYKMYVESFENLRTGYGAAVTCVFLLLTVSLTLLQAWATERRIHYS